MALDPCPKCGGATKTAPNLEPPFGFCDKCTWFTHAFNDKHNTLLIALCSDLDTIQKIIESTQKDIKEECGWCTKTREIAYKLLNLLKHMKKEGVR